MRGNLNCFVRRGRGCKSPCCGSRERYCLGWSVLRRVVGASLAASLTCWALSSALWAAEPPYIKHREYQAVDPNGSSAYPPASFPVRLVGVVLNNNEDWLDPTSDFDPGYHPWQMGAQAEIYVQAVDLDAFAQWDPFPGEPFDDFGGTACWIGQNYGNHPFFHPPDPEHPEWNSEYNYTEAEWYAELDRLHLWYAGTPLEESQLARAGDLVLITARGGLNYKGKMNVNEKHNKDPVLDYEITILQKGIGLPEPLVLALSDLKDADDKYLFDADPPMREFGGERYQSSLVKLTNVRFSDDFDPATQWRAYPSNDDSGLNFTLVDPTGRTLPVHLGRNESFNASPAPQGCFDLVGILDQSDATGKGGYRLLALRAGDFILGDLNHDGRIDAHDLNIVLVSWGQAVEAGWMHLGDSSGDGLVEAHDLNGVLANWGSGTQPAGLAGTHAVPEPATLGLLAYAAAALAVWAVWGRSRRRRTY